MLHDVSPFVLSQIQGATYLIRGVEWAGGPEKASKESSVDAMAEGAQPGIPPSVRRSEIVLAQEVQERGTPIFTFAIETSIHPLPRAPSVRDSTRLVCTILR